MKRPKVKIVKGKVRIIKTGLMIALRTPKMTAAPNAERKPSTSIPGTK